jgi:predicted ArsR family transcriptional regulator
MAVEPWSGRSLAGTRGRLIALLRRASHTVEDLAQELGVTDNAIRSHLAKLEQDGLVQQRGVRRGNSKPARLYKLTPQAERLFPKAYEEVLAELLGIVGRQQSPEQLGLVFREVGQHLAARHPLPADGDPPAGSKQALRARLHGAVAALNQLGGLMELEEDADGTLSICGYSCPLAAVTATHREVCGLIAAMVTQWAGVPVQAQCERSEAFWCWLDVRAT